MASTLKIPQPGDLITAQDMAAFIAALTALDARVTQLEQIVPGGTGNVAIFDLQWAGSDLHLGDELTIVGVNLGLQGESRVDFSTLASVTQYEAGSDDFHIVLKVPSMALGGASKTLPLTVANSGHGSDTRSVTLLQGVSSTPDGTVTFQPATFPAGDVNPNADLIVSFPLLVSSLNMNTTFDIAASASLLFNPAQSMTTEVLNDINQVITTITLAKVDQTANTATLKVRVKVPALPQGVTKADATVLVTLSTAGNANFKPTSGLVPFQVGAAAPAPGDFPVSLDAVQATTTDPSTGTITLPTSAVPAGGYLASVTADLSSDKLPLGESYTVTPSGPSGWSFAGSDSGFTLSVRGPQHLHLRITPQSSPATGPLTIKIASSTHSSSATYTLAPKTS